MLAFGLPKLFIIYHRYLYPMDPTRLDQSGSMMEEEEEDSSVSKKKKDN